MKRVILMALLSISVSFGVESSVNCFWEEPIKENYGKAKMNYMCIDNNLYIINLKVNNFKNSLIMMKNKANLPTLQINLQIESVAPVLNKNSNNAITCVCRAKVEGN